MLESLIHAEAIAVFTYTVFNILSSLSGLVAGAEILANKKVPGINGAGETFRRSDNGEAGHGGVIPQFGL